MRLNQTNTLPIYNYLCNFAQKYAYSKIEMKSFKNIELSLLQKSLNGELEIESQSLAKEIKSPIAIEEGKINNGIPIISLTAL